MSAQAARTAVIVVLATFLLTFVVSAQMLPSDSADEQNEEPLEEAGGGEESQVSDLFTVENFPERGPIFRTFSGDNIEVYIDEILSARLDDDDRKHMCGVPVGTHWVRASFSDGMHRVARVEFEEGDMFRDEWVDLYMPTDELGTVPPGWSRWLLLWLSAGILLAGLVLTHATCERRQAALGFVFAVLVTFIPPAVLLYAWSLRPRRGKQNLDDEDGDEITEVKILLMLLVAGTLIGATGTSATAADLYLRSEKQTYDVKLNGEEVPSISIGPEGDGLNHTFENLAGETEIRAEPIDGGRARGRRLDLPSDSSVRYCRHIDHLPVIPIPPLKLVGQAYGTFGVLCAIFVLIHGLRARENPDSVVPPVFPAWVLGSLVLPIPFVPIYAYWVTPPRAQLTQAAGNLTFVERIVYLFRRVFFGRTEARRYALAARSRREKRAERETQTRDL